MLDICLCGSTDCEKYSQCIRGDAIKREGIFTMSYLSEICNVDTDYKCYMPIDNEEFKEIVIKRKEI